MRKVNFKTNTGFTIIETMIAVSLFLVVTIAGMGALLNANLLHHKSQGQREIMDNLSFIMEDMSRNLRTGSNYHCIDDGDFKTNTIKDAKSCFAGGAIAFEWQDGSRLDTNDQWVYSIETRDGGQTYNIYKSTDSWAGGGANSVQLNPPQVIINPVSSFSVLGAEAPDPTDGSGNHQQPFITITLVGTIQHQNTVTPFSLQTSVSQRAIDI